jgi:hypothetical protein
MNSPLQQDQTGGYDRPGAMLRGKSNSSPAWESTRGLTTVYLSRPSGDETMQTAQYQPSTRRYAKCIENSKRIRWDIDSDVIRGREFDFSRKFLPDGISKVDRIAFLSQDEVRLLSQIQGRTYANMFGLVERFINAKVLEVSRDHWLGDQTALEALVRFSDEELKHQALFRRIEVMIASGMRAGYRFAAQPDEVANIVLGKSTWSVLALTYHIELFTLAHYLQSIAPDTNLSELYKDVFLYHWKEESQHAILDELEWVREDAKLTAEAREAAVDDLIELVKAVDGILQVQAAADAKYFFQVCEREFSAAEGERVKSGILQAYRWQYIVSGVEQPRFMSLLTSLITRSQASRIGAALGPIMS